MELVRTIPESRGLRRQWHQENSRVALVPTMGALHEGHLSLVRRAKELANRVVVSIFVNPTQFGPNEDFQRYPRPLEKDLGLLEAEKVDGVYIPDASGIYPADFRTFVTVEELSEKLCGKTRPGHFRGVTTIVCKLFSIWQPELALFGWKDAQQCILIRRMIEDLSLPVELVACPIVRESDGLALSSRNRYLNQEERAAATSLNRSLRWAKDQAVRGELSSAVLLDGVKSLLHAEPLIRLDYAEIVDLHDLSPLETVTPSALLALAAFLGKTRLIDNVVLLGDLHQ
ncbi:MAG: pantoate--beta-alanine ligase [Terriglobia bacterium]